MLPCAGSTPGRPLPGAREPLRRTPFPQRPAAGSRSSRRGLVPQAPVHAPLCMEGALPPMGESGAREPGCERAVLAPLSPACAPEPWLKEWGRCAAWSQVPPRLFLKTPRRRGRPGTWARRGCRQMPSWGPPASPTRRHSPSSTSDAAGSASRGLLVVPRGLGLPHQPAHLPERGGEESRPLP